MDDRLTNSSHDNHTLGVHTYGTSMARCLPLDICLGNPDTNMMAVMFGNTLTYPLLTALGIPLYTIENVIKAHHSILPNTSYPANTLGLVNASGIRKVLGGDVGWLAS
jgi:hypothetical protein